MSENYDEQKYLAFQLIGMLTEKNEEPLRELLGEFYTGNINGATFLLQVGKCMKENKISLSDEKSAELSKLVKLIGKDNQDAATQRGLAGLGLFL
ncbi:hypothetical protein [Companilactobacillus metriopterae]|uniref:hypothetical protein n=1 Tax=Companilactobacillus metriopterae TaxID=1909267 RepID=UPI00100AD014|nr:hypothetical protein [Companilactobacillus metriopterae]